MIEANNIRIYKEVDIKDLIIGCKEIFDQINYNEDEGILISSSKSEV